MATNISVAYHNLSMMLSAGVPMLRSLNTVASGLSRPLQAEFLGLADAVAAGDTIAETMARSPRIFDSLDVMLIHAGETSGSLAELLRLLSHWHEFSQRITNKTLSGITLPVVLIHLAAFVAPLPAFFLGGWKILPYFTSAIRILLLFYVPAGVIYIIRKIMPAQGPLRTVVDRIVLKIPVLGHAVYKLALSRYCWVFYMLLKAGLPITACAEKAAAVAGNAVAAQQLATGAESAKAGNPVSHGFSSRLPAEFLHVWHVGEETGKLEDVTKRLADSNAEDAEFLFTEFSRWLPRLVYWFVAALIIYHILRNAGLIMSAGR